MLNFSFFNTSSPFCLSSSLLPSSFVVYLLSPEEDNFLSKALMYFCFLVFRRIGEYISLDLFYIQNTRKADFLVTFLSLCNNYQQQQQLRHLSPLTSHLSPPPPRLHCCRRQRAVQNWQRTTEQPKCSGAVWKSRWPSWAFRPNEPFCGRKATPNHAYALVTVCP